MRKIILSILGVVLIIAAYFGATAIIDSNTVERPPITNVVKTVFVDSVRNSTVPITIPASGNVTALRKLEIFSEVEGVFRNSSKDYRPGQQYNQGQLLLNIDGTEFASSVRSVRSDLYNSITALMPDLRLDYPEVYPKWQEYLNKFDVNKTLPELPELSSDKEKYFISGRGIVSAYYSIKNLETRLQKFNIYAPFNGTLTEATVTEGSLVRPGQKLGEFIDPTVFELEVAIRTSFSDLLKVGEKVELNNLENSRVYTGTVSRINSRVDPNSQTIQVFIKIEDANIREGMYLEANLSAKDEENAFIIARELLVDQSKVYVVRDNILALVEVDPVYYYQDKVVIKGLKDDTQLISAPVPGAYAGMEVEISKTPNPVKS